MGARYSFRLLGTGSSGGVPRLGNDWGVCDPAEPRNRRSRCCALVTRVSASGSTRALIDTSPDIRLQLLATGIKEIDAIIYTHDHADQTHGIDDVRVLALHMRQQIPVHMDEATMASLVPRFRYCFEGKGGYPPILETQAPIVHGEAFKIDGNGGPIVFLPIDQVHGAIRSLGFRMGALAYCNDVSALPETAHAQLADLDVLILDALRRSPHPTHAHLDQALEWAEQLGAKRTVLTNMHNDLDYRTLCSELPEGVEPGYDGMEITFSGYPL